MKKNDRLQVKIEGYTSDGYGVAKPDGFVLFIPGTLEGETVLAHVTKVNKSFGFAKAIEIIQPSPERVKPLCTVCQSCGGCELWHMTYAEELRFKKQKVAQNLLKAGIDLPPDDVVGAPSLTQYRNKAQYPIRFQNGKVCGGFYRPASHSVIEGRCMIQPKLFDDILAAVIDFMNKNGVTAYDEQTLTGTVRHLYLRKAQSGIMVCLVVNGKFALKEQLKQTLTVQFPQISTICINYNCENTNVVLGKRYETVYGDGFITDRLCDRLFDISPESFYQVNHDGCEQLYELVRKYAHAEGKKVLDLYCGIGTIGICAAADARELVGVEIVEKAVINAHSNAVKNGMDNARFIAGDAGHAVNKAGSGFDVITVDPPRKGCDRKTLDFLINESPERLVYVSCDSATLARDLRILSDGGFDIERITPVDMFPRTKHVETVALLSRQKVDKHIYFDVNVGDLPKTTTRAKTVTER